MQNLLSQCTNIDYSEWKNQRKDLIEKLKPQLLNSPENEIATFYSYLENEIKGRINSHTNIEFLRALHFCSILYHFQRNHDTISSYYSTIAQKLNDADRPIANAISKTFYWLAEDSNEFYQAFREPLSVSHRILKYKSKNHYNALILLKRIRKFLASELIQIIFSSLQDFIDIASIADKESQIITLKLFEFVFSNISDINLQSNFDIFYESSKKFLESTEDNLFFCGVRFYDFLLYIKSFETPPQFDLIISKADGKSDFIIQSSIKLVFHAKQKFKTLNYHSNAFLKFILDNFQKIGNPFQVLNDFLLNFKDDADISLIYNAVFDYLQKQPKCTENHFCPFFTLHRVFQVTNYQYINDSTDDSFNKIFAKNFEYINNFTPCKHYMKCSLKCPLLLTSRIHSFFQDHFKPDDPNYQTCLILYPKYSSLFPQDIDQFTDELNSILLTTDSNRVKKRILKTLYHIGSKKSIESIFFASLTDKDDSIRLFALDLLPEETLLEMGDSLFDYLNDFSYAIQKRAVKLIAKLYNKNPLEYQPFIIKKIQTLLIFVIQGIDVGILSDVASLLASFTKYFKDSLPHFVYLDILTVSLTILNSTTKKGLTVLSPLQNPGTEIARSRTNLMSTPSLTANSDSSSSESKSIENKESSPNSPAISTSPLTNESHMSPVLPNLQLAYARSNVSVHTNEYPDLPMSSSTSQVSFRSQLDANINDNSMKALPFKSSMMSIFDTETYKLPRIDEENKKFEKEPNRGKLFRIFKMKYIEERDKYLLKTITNLSGKCPNNLVNHVLVTFYNIFVKTRNEDFLQSAAKSLTQFAISVQNGLNICKRCPQMTAPLFQILASTSNKKLAASIIRLIGTAFDSVDLLFSQALTPYSNDLSELLSDTSSFCTNLVIRNLLKNSYDPDLLTLKTLSMIVDGDPTNSMKYLPKIAQVFIHALKKASPIVRSQAFGYLTTIAQKCIVDFVPLLPSFYPIFKAFICTDSCLRFLTLLSYSLKTDFIEAGNELFICALRSLNKIDPNSFHSLVTFIGSLIIYQHLSFEAFLNSIERVELTKKTAAPTICITTTIIQSIDISGFTMRLVRLALNQLIFPHLDINDYFVSLCIYGKLKVSQMKQFYNAKHLIFKHFDELEDICNQKTIERPSFLKEMSLIFPINHSFLKLATNHFFVDLEYPNELHINLWIKDLLKIMVSRSASASIRAYAPLFSASSKFDTNLFDVAFLSCWKSASDIDHERLTAIVEHAIQHHRKVHPIFFQMIYLSNKLLIPMKVDIQKVYELSSSRPNTLFMLQRELQMNQNDKNLNRMLINTLIQMGRFATARGLLRKVKPIMDIKDFAKWSDELGEWEKALEIYKAENAGLPLILNCLEEMCEYNEIGKYEKEFQKMTDDEKREVMDHFLWYFQLKNETEKVEEIIRLIGDKWTLFRIIFAVYYYIKAEKYEKAKELIVIGYQILANSKNEYSLGDQIQLTEIHRMSQILIESEEVLNYKITKSSMEQITSFFTSRVENFKRNRFIWERTICLRQILVPIESNISYYLPIISKLRKAQKFKLLQYYFNQPLNISNEWQILIQRIKINSKTGHEIDSLTFCEQIAKALNLTRQYDFIEILENIPMIFHDSILYSFEQTNEFTDKMLNYLIEKTHCETKSQIWKSYLLLNNNEKSDLYKNFINEFKSESAACMQQIIFQVAESNQFVSKINHLAGNFIITYLPYAYESVLKASKYFKVSVEFEPEKIKMWRNWAFVNVRLFNLVKSEENSEAKLDLYSKSAIEAFLKLCTHLNINDTLEYSSQLMSIVNASSDTVTSQFISEITSLPSAVFIKILPLLTSKIDIPDLTKRSMIITILTNAGINYFQEIYFPLNLYVDTGHSEFFADENDLEDESDSEKSLIASQILAKLKEMRPKEADEIDLFIDGMVRCAISWFELAMHSIETILKGFMKQKSEKSMHLLDNLFNLFEHPKCELDNLFLSLYQNVITSCTHHFMNMKSNGCHSPLLKSYGRTTDVKNEEALLTAKLRSWYTSLKERVTRLSVIFLSKISEELLNKKTFLMNAPSYTDCKIESIDPVMDVLETQQHPRVALINTTKGEKSKYLLKGNEDLRLDERLMMLFNLTNGIINRNPKIKEYQTSIIRYAVIPMTKTAGLIKWVTGADTFYQLITERRESEHIPKDAENTVIKNLIDCNFITLNGLQRLEMFYEIENYGMEKNNKKAKRISIVDARKSQISNSTTKLSSNLISMQKGYDKPKKKLNLISRNDHENASKLNISMLSKLSVTSASTKVPQVEEKIQTEIDRFTSQELADVIWLRSPNAPVWVKRTASFTTSYSLMAIVGYIIGLGDRHPGNIMIQRDTGNVVHIDFGESFDTAMLRSSYPEKVPFRLTKMVINALEGRIETGLFQEFAIDIMDVLRRNKDTLMGQIAVFFEEPALAHFKKIYAKQTKSFLMDGCYKKLAGLKYGESEPIDVKTQVEQLIKCAADPANYIKHYPGWCPFW